MKSRRPKEIKSDLIPVRSRWSQWSRSISSANRLNVFTGFLPLFSSPDCLNSYLKRQGNTPWSYSYICSSDSYKGNCTYVGLRSNWNQSAELILIFNCNFEIELLYWVQNWVQYSFMTITPASQHAALIAPLGTYTSCRLYKTILVISKGDNERC